MSKSRHLLEDWLQFALAPLGQVRVRAMFGGYGVSLDGLSIGLIAGNLLFLKVDSATATRFEALGLEPFTYDRGGVPVAMSYRRAPDSALDDPATMREWGELALAAARRTRRPKRGA